MLIRVIILEGIRSNMESVPDHIQQQFKEIRELYGITEAEMICMTQMSMLIKMLGYSPQLTVKLLKALTAMFEITVDEMEREQKKK